MVLDVQRQEVALNLNSDWGFKFGPVNTLKGFGDAHLTVLTVKGDEGLRFGGLNKRFREYYRQPVNYYFVTDGLPTILQLSKSGQLPALTHERAVSNRDFNPGAPDHAHSGHDSESENKTIQTESCNGGSITRPE